MTIKEQIHEGLLHTIKTGRGVALYRGTETSNLPFLTIVPSSVVDGLHARPGVYLIAQGAAAYYDGMPVNDFQLASAGFEAPLCFKLAEALSEAMDTIVASLKHVPQALPESSNTTNKTKEKTK